MVKKQKKRAFSLVDAIIILMAVAVAIVVSTPMLTRKTVDNAEIGGSLTGGAHGRYEIFHKELATFDNGVTWYERGIESNDELLKSEYGKNPNGVTIYERLSDLDYKDITGKAPAYDAETGNKDTLYKEFSNVISIKNDIGEIVKFKFSATGAEYNVGGKYILENNNIQYYETNKEGVRQKKDSKVKKLYNDKNDTHRIIEGYLTTKYASKKVTNNLWQITTKNPNHYATKAPVIIPWTRMYNGGHVVQDQKASSGTIKIDLDKNVKNIAIHAVGGGGAGGAVIAPGKAITPKDATQEQLKQMQADLAERFRQAAGNLPKSSWPDATVVTIKNVQDLHEKHYSEIFDSDKNYIVINKYDGTIIGKIDITTNGKIVYPHQILKYTKILGSKAQNSVKYDMPEWVTKPTLANSGYYVAAVGCGGKGGVGGNWSSYTECVNDPGVRQPVWCKKTWKQTSDDTAYGNVEQYIVRTSTSYNYCTAYKVCPANGGGGAGGGGLGQPKNLAHYLNAAKIDYKKLEKEFGIVDVAFALRDNYNLISRVEEHYTGGGGSSSCNPNECVSSEQRCTVTSRTPTSCVVNRTCVFDETSCDKKYYDILENKPEYPKGRTTSHTVTETNCSSDSCHAAQQCSEYNGNGNVKYREKSCINYYPPGGVANPPACAIACTPVTGDPIATGSGCSGNFVGDGGQSAGMVECGAKVNVSAGKQGRVCNPYAGSVQAYSHSGTGSSPKCKRKIDRWGDEISESDADKRYDMAKGNYEKAIERGQDGTYWLNIMNTYATICNFDVDANFLENTGICTGTPGGKGSASTASSNCPANAKGLPPRECSNSPTCNLTVSATPDSPDIYNKTYNHIYVWSIPYSVNQLTYGEAGEAGEYATTRISQVTDKFYITLGKGGVLYSKDKKKNVVNGTDTFVKMGSNEVLRAKGGRGGNTDVKTHKYDLCYAVAGECKNSANSPNKVSCCNNEEASRSTKEIIATAVKMSLFENIKALAGNSTIVGIGAGRGGEGVGTRAGGEEMYDERMFINSSSYNASSGNVADRIIWGDDNDKNNKNANAAKASKSEYYNNSPLKPSELNSKGGDGAVIIVW